jgi:glycosyltransferase involved in cell wall biosynthesis
VILAHGTEEPPCTLTKYSYLQHLAPCYLEDWGHHRPARQRVFAIGNFVDTDVFKPGDKAAARQDWELPRDHLIVLCVAAIKKTHKRVDYVVKEFSRFLDQSSRPATLVVAGSRESESDEVIFLGRKLLGDRVRFLEAVPRDRMPGLYRAADLYSIASLHEMMPIAVLEALASALPIACNNTPTLRWMTGPAGKLQDISNDGGLAAQFAALSLPDVREELSRAARRHAETTFSEPVVLRQIVEMYRQVAAVGR